MNKHNKNIEELLRQEFSGFEIQPSPEVWNKVSYRLIRESFTRFNPHTFNIYYALLLAITIAFGVLLLAVSKQEIAVSEYSAAISEIPIINNEQKVKEKKDSISDIGLQKADAKATLIVSETTKPDIEQITGPKLPEYTEEIWEKDLKTDRNTDNEKISGNYLPPPLPKACFNITLKEGCAPLKVQFMNFSENTVQYNWSFGDGGSSSEKDPTYVFDEPGIYKITLTASCINNTIHSFTDSIHVYALPEIRFEMEVPDKAVEGQLVYFYNYSRGAVEYRWDFGDGNISDQKDPFHLYNKAGILNIKLSATTTEGCVDSAVVNDIMKTEGPEIRFPTAFCPNNSGPAGGYYSRYESNPDVFYPYTSELSAEYILRIFNRKGNMIFKSNDINIGWDGYYRQELQPPGVYVWKVRVRFADGRTIVQAGDVTLLWRP